MDKKLNFNEMDILNATWSGMEALKGKKQKDATDANAISKGLAAITKYMDLKMKWKLQCKKQPDLNNVHLMLLSDRDSDT